MKIGDKVFVPETLNSVWAGEAEVVKFYDDDGGVMLRMTSGRMTGKYGWFDDRKLLSEAPPIQVVGGAPHGFGVWVKGKYHPVDIGALGDLIIKLQTENNEMRSKLNQIFKLGYQGHQ